MEHKIKGYSNPKGISLKRMTFVIYSTILTLCIMGCDEERFLEENPMDFYSPSNSFVTSDQYQSALIQLYADYRDNYWSEDDVNGAPRTMFYGTDLVMNDKDLGSTPPDYTGITVPTSIKVQDFWVDTYKMISNANIIAERVLETENELEADEKFAVKAEALFFRALGHKMLANLYGGVPIVLQETKEPKRDFVRASRNEVYQQCAEDLEFAVQHLSDISETDDHRINRQAAYHLLSEVYISLERWDDAISAATTVIDNGSLSLMLERFGSRIDDSDFGGDVYWDLFRQGNQNRSSGNTESLWVLQYENLVDGGQSGGMQLERQTIPRLWRTTINDTDGVTRNLIVGGPNTNYYGRGSGFQRPTSYFFNELWEKSGASDIRNSEFNIVRDFRVQNPDSPSNGMFALANGLVPQETYTDTARDFYPVIAKNSTPGNHPQVVFNPDQSVPGALLSTARRTYRDHYSMRLAETYLLRAEAHLGNGDPGLAAEDINVVRRRANAPDVTPEEVDIDYILDERLRELHYEEFRLLTLTRLGKVAERTRMYNPEYVGATIQDYHNLWPIPFSEIEANTEAVLEQNPGY